MNKEVKQRIDKLKKLIDYHRYLYHVLDRQEISEESLDSLKKELFDLEQKYPEFVTPDSPTQRIGGEPLEKFEKIKHSTPMLSLNDAFSKNDIYDWLKRIGKIIEKDISKEKDFNFFCELKIDGLAFELVYKNGYLVSGSTRGDGFIGENVTENLKRVNSVPLKIKNELHGLEKIKGINKTRKEIEQIINNGEIIVRGEIFINKKTFNEINESRKKEGLELYANPRNVAAGSIRQLDPKIVASRKMDSFVYDLVTDLGVNTHSEKHEILKILGFKINPYQKICSSTEKIFDFYHEVMILRDDLSYEIDGMIAIINDNEIFNNLGVVGKSPRGAIAFKFPLKEATTIVNDISFQIGRTGVLTPIAFLKPVDLSGVVITKATLHNEDEIKRLSLKIGDTVIVGRAGDVIPDIIKVLTSLRSGKEKEFHFPKKCPECFSFIKKTKKTSTTYYCPNSKCPGRLKEYFSYFVSRKAFNFEGLGKQITNKLIKNKMVSSPVDLFFLKKEDLLKLDGFQEKLANNIIKSIQNKKTVSLSKLIYSLGIENVGEETSVLLENSFKTLENIKKASLDELILIKDIGEITANKIYDWFRNKDNENFLNRLDLADIKIIKKPEKLNEKFKNKNFVLTGSLSMPREKVKEEIKKRGGEISETVCSKIDFIIVGDNPGSKLNKAEKMLIKKITEDDFLKMIND